MSAASSSAPATPLPSSTASSSRSLASSAASSSSGRTSVARSYASASLYVGDLAPEVTEALLFETFNTVGSVASVRVCRDAATRRSLGYAYVNFHRVDDAERALDTMNFKPIRGRPARMMWSYRDPRYATLTVRKATTHNMIVVSLRKSGQGNTFVKNLARTIDNKQLYDTFSVFGNILSCKVATDSKGASLGYGFVHYESEEAAATAIAKSILIALPLYSIHLNVHICVNRVNGKVIAGEKVFAAVFKSKQDRGGEAKRRFTNLYVKCLPRDFTKDKLESLFSPYGNITSVILKFVDKDFKPRGKKASGSGSDSKDGEEKEVKNTSGETKTPGLLTPLAGRSSMCFAHTLSAGSPGVEGYGFVNFATPEEAAAALAALHNLEITPGKRLYVARAQKKEERQKELRQRFEQLKTEREKKYAGTNLYVKNLGDDIDDERLRVEFGKYGSITSARVMKDEATKKSRGFGFVCFTTADEATTAVTEMNRCLLEGKPLYVSLAQRKEARRLQLEARHAARNKTGAGPTTMSITPHLYPHNGAPLFYGPPHSYLYPDATGRVSVPVYQLVAVPTDRVTSLPAPTTSGAGRTRHPPDRAPRTRMPPRAAAAKRDAGRAMPSAAPTPAAPATSDGGGLVTAAGFQYKENIRNPTGAGGAGASGPTVSTSETIEPTGASTSSAVSAQAALTIKMLAAAPEKQKKQMIGEQLFPLIASQQPMLAGKITGMLLEMDNGELIHLLESPPALSEKIVEALAVLQAHGISSVDEEEEEEDDE